MFDEKTLHVVNNTIHHTGIVTAVHSQRVEVKILQMAACAGCHIRSMCQTSESKEKIVVVMGRYPNLSVGQEVNIEGSLRSSRWAVVLAYVIPLVLLMAVLFAGTKLWNEATGALLGFIALAVYYVVLYLMRQRIRQSFSFRIV